MKSKVCSKCKIEKDLASFSKNNSKKSGLKATCKDCDAIARKQWKLANSDKVRAGKKKYRAKSITHKLAKKRWLKNNPDKKKEYAKRYYLNKISRLGRPLYKNKEQVKEIIRKYRKTLSDIYVSSLIVRRTNILAKDIRQYPELIEAKRAQLMILRKIRTKPTNNHEQP